MNNGHMHFLALFITSDQYVSCFNVIICRPLFFCSLAFECRNLHVLAAPGPRAGIELICIGGGDFVGFMNFPRKIKGIFSY